MTRLGGPGVAFSEISGSRCPGAARRGFSSVTNAPHLCHRRHRVSQAFSAASTPGRSSIDVLWLYGVCDEDTKKNTNGHR